MNRNGTEWRLCSGPRCGCKTAHTLEHDAELGYCWKCGNCRKLTKRVKRTAVKDADGMTAAQRKAVERIREGIVVQHYGYEHRESYEIKTFEVNVRSGYVSLVVETGRIGDEGTYGALLCRRRVHVAIGVRGGLEALNVEKKSTLGGWFDVYHGVPR